MSNDNDSRRPLTWSLRDDPNDETQLGWHIPVYNPPVRFTPSIDMLNERSDRTTYNSGVQASVGSGGVFHQYEPPSAEFELNPGNGRFFRNALMRGDVENNGEILRVMDMTENEDGSLHVTVQLNRNEGDFTWTRHPLPDMDPATFQREHMVTPPEEESDPLNRFTRRVLGIPQQEEESDPISRSLRRAPGPNPRELSWRAFEGDPILMGNPEAFNQVVDWTAADQTSTTELSRTVDIQDEAMGRSMAAIRGESFPIDYNWSMAQPPLRLNPQDDETVTAGRVEPPRFSFRHNWGLTVGSGATGRSMAEIVDEVGDISQEVLDDIYNSLGIPPAYLRPENLKKEEKKMFKPGLVICKYDVVEDADGEEQEILMNPPANEADVLTIIGSEYELVWWDGDDGANCWIRASNDNYEVACDWASQVTFYITLPKIEEVMDNVRKRIE